jgi:hypothetical protein
MNWNYQNLFMRYRREFVSPYNILTDLLEEYRLLGRNLVAKGKMCSRGNLQASFGFGSMTYTNEFKKGFVGRSPDIINQKTMKVLGLRLRIALYAMDQAEKIIKPEAKDSISKFLKQYFGDWVAREVGLPVSDGYSSRAEGITVVATGNCRELRELVEEDITQFGKKSPLVKLWDDKCLCTTAYVDSFNDDREGFDTQCTWKFIGKTPRSDKDDWVYISVHTFL